MEGSTGKLQCKPREKIRRNGDGNDNGDDDNGDHDYNDNVDYDGDDKVL
jgi:hypothetical protein